MKELPVRAAVLVSVLLALGSPPSRAAADPQSYSDPGIETFPDEGNAHVPVGTVVVYATDPPTSGPHYPDPQPGGYYESPIQAGFLVHSMEHGGIIIYYNPATVTDSQKYSLKLLARAHPGIMAMVVCVPRNDPAYPIILTAWTHRLRLMTFDQSRISGFMTLFLGQGPEKGNASPAPVWPAPLLSRGKPVFATVDNADAPALVDGMYGVSGPGASWRPGTLPASAAIQIGSGYDSVLLSWNTPGSGPNYTTKTTAPQDYTVEASSNSTNGSNGTWTSLAMFNGNTTRARAHQVNFSGMSWIRLTISKAPQGVDIDEIDVHGLSQPNPDTVFFMGDSISSVAFDRIPAHQPSYAEDVHASDAEFFPAMIDGGVQGDRSSDGVGHIGGWLGLNPTFSVWGLGYGTNDAGENVPPSNFQANLQSLIDQIKAAGKIPVIARIPYSPLAGYSTIPTYNQIIDQLATANSLVPGPDLFAWFQSHPGEIGADGIHPTDAGAASINRLWAGALSSLYVPPPHVPSTTAPPPPTPPPPPSPSPSPSNSSGGSSHGCGLLGLEALIPLLLMGSSCRRPRRLKT